MSMTKRSLVAAACSSILLGVVMPASGGGVQPDIVAAPEVYKVIAEDDNMRVVLATWPPGYKDKMHSHPHQFAAYIVKDCHRKHHSADGKVDEKHLKAGAARIVKPVKAHAFENVGKTECQIVLFEMKK